MSKLGEGGDVGEENEDVDGGKKAVARLNDDSKARLMRKKSQKRKNTVKCVSGLVWAYEWSIGLEILPMIGYTAGMQAIINTLRQTLKAESSEEGQKSAQRFFKEEIKTYGTKSAQTKQIAEKLFSGIKDLPKEGIWSIAEILMQSGYLEEFSIACVWVSRTHKDLKPKDWTTIDRWVDSYITNWAACDVFCCGGMGKGGTVSTFLEMYPQNLKKLLSWAKSKNLWKRRAAAVSLVGAARQGQFHNTVFEIAETLLLDSEDMVQKGYGWMLKAAADFDQQAVFQFIMNHKVAIPRTALRYAIEKMPKSLKTQAMKLD